MEFINGHMNPFFALLILSISLLFVYLKLLKPKNKLHLPPSPPKLPIIGNIHQLGKLPHRSFADLAAKYGSLLLLQVGHNPTLVVSSAELAKEVVKKHDVVFSNRPKTTAANILLYGCTDMGFLPYGEYWRQVRKLSVLELFSHKRVESFQFVRDEEVEALVNKFRNASISGETVNLTKMVFSVSNNIVSRCALGRRFEDGDKFSDLARKVMVLLTKFSIGDAFPYLRWLDYVNGFIPNLKATFAELDEWLDEIVEESRKSGSQKQKNEKDLLSILLELQKDDNGLIEMELTQDNIKAMILDIFIGGSDTTSTTTEWLMAELLRHPNIMKKVQNEVRNIVGFNKSKVEADDISKMEYLKCVIKETFRLHPTAPLLVPRKTSAAVELSGYHIPSDVTVFINAFAIHRDPKWWDRPDEFIPERFENSDVDFKGGQDFQLMPFGCGRRRCPGMTFGMASVEYLSANLLYWFDWELELGEGGGSLDMDEVYGLTVNKKIPLLVKPVSHPSSST